MAGARVLCRVITLLGDGILRGSFDTLSVAIGAGGFFLGQPVFGFEVSVRLPSFAVSEH